jgi:hypothetical protein
LFCKNTEFKSYKVMEASTQMSKEGLALYSRVKTSKGNPWEVMSEAMSVKSKILETPGSWCWEYRISAIERCRQWTEPAQERGHVNCNWQGSRGGVVKVLWSIFPTVSGCWTWSYRI